MNRRSETALDSASSRQSQPYRLVLAAPTLAGFLLLDTPRLPAKA